MSGPTKLSSKETIIDFMRLAYVKVFLSSLAIYSFFFNLEANIHIVSLVIDKKNGSSKKDENALASKIQNPT